MSTCASRLSKVAVITNGFDGSCRRRAAATVAVMCRSVRGT